MWHPSDIRKLIAQLAGILLGVAGLYLIINDVNATGKINISSNLLSGQIETGSAGLMLLFIAFMLISLPALFGSQSHSLINVTDQSSKSQITYKYKYLIALCICIILSLSLAIGGELMHIKLGLKIGEMFSFGGFMLGGFTGLMLVGGIIEWLSDAPDKTENETD